MEFLARISPYVEMTKNANNKTLADFTDKADKIILICDPDSYREW